MSRAPDAPVISVDALERAFRASKLPEVVAIVKAVTSTVAPPGSSSDTFVRAMQERLRSPEVWNQVKEEVMRSAAASAGAGMQGGVVRQAGVPPQTSAAPSAGGTAARAAPGTATPETDTRIIEMLAHGFVCGVLKGSTDGNKCPRGNAAACDEARLEFRKAAQTLRTAPESLDRWVKLMQHMLKCLHQNCQLCSRALAMASSLDSSIRKDFLPRLLENFGYPPVSRNPTGATRAISHGSQGPMTGPGAGAVGVKPGTMPSGAHGRPSTTAYNTQVGGIAAGSGVRPGTAAHLAGGPGISQPVSATAHVPPGAGAAMQHARTAAVPAKGAASVVTETITSQRSQRTGPALSSYVPTQLRIMSACGVDCGIDVAESPLLRSAAVAAVVAAAVDKPSDITAVTVHSAPARAPAAIEKSMRTDLAAYDDAATALYTAVQEAAITDKTRRIVTSQAVTEVQFMTAAHRLERTQAEAEELKASIAVSGESADASAAAATKLAALQGRLAKATAEYNERYTALREGALKSEEQFRGYTVNWCDAGVCSVNGAGLASRMRMLAHEHRVLLYDEDRLTSCDPVTGVDAPSFTSNTTDATVSTAVSSSAPPASNSWLTAVGMRLPNSVDLVPHRIVGELGTLVSPASVAGARPLPAANASPVALMQQIVMHLVLSVAAGVLATARFQQQQLQTLTPILTPAADGSSGGAVNKAASAVGVAHAPAGRTGSVGVRLPELTSAIVPPVEVRESSDPAVAAIWQEIHSQWKTYYETERSNMLARARALHAGSVGKSRISAQVHGSSIYDMNSPMLDDACPMASTYRHLVAQACQATCHEYYYQTALKRWEEVLNTSNRALSDTLNENLVQMETSLVDHLMAPKYADEVQAAVAVDALGGELRAGVAPHMASATGPGAMPLPRITSSTVLRYFADALQILRTGSARRCAPPVAVRLSAPSAAPDAAYASSAVAGRKRTHQQMTTAASKDAVDGTDAEAGGAGGRESNAAKRARVGEGDDAVDTSPAATSAAPAGTVPEPSAATNQAATSHAESVAELRSMCEVLPMVAPSFGSHPRVLSWLQWSASHAQFMELRKREEEELHRLSDEARLLTKAKVSHLPGANVVAGAHFPYSLDLV